MKKKFNTYRIMKRNKLLGKGQVKMCFDAVDKVVKIPNDIDLSIKYDIIKVREFKTTKDIRKVYKHLENNPFRWRVKSFVIEKYLFDKIMEIGKKYNINVSIFAPILKFYYNKNNVPVIVSPKAEYICGYKEAIEKTNSDLHNITRTIETVANILTNEYNIQMYLGDIFYNDGNCGIINGRFSIVDYGYADIIKV